MIIFNATQHNPTPEQVEAGVMNASPEIQKLITFTTAPTAAEMKENAKAVAKIAAAALNKIGVPSHERAVMIGGAPYFMPHLEKALFKMGLTPIYAFSQRVCVEQNKEDGSVEKTFVFKHAGWIVAEKEE